MELLYETCVICGRPIGFLYCEKQLFDWFCRLVSSWPHRITRRAEGRLQGPRRLNFKIGRSFPLSINFDRANMLRNDNLLTYFVDGKAPLTHRVLVPCLSFMSALGAVVLHTILPEIKLIALPYKPPPGVYYFGFPEGPDTIITIKHLSLPLAGLAAGVMVALVSLLIMWSNPFPNVKRAAYEGILTTYLIQVICLGIAGTVWLLFDELQKGGILGLVGDIFPVMLTTLAIWFIVLVGFGCLFVFPEVAAAFCIFQLCLAIGMRNCSSDINNSNCSGKPPLVL